MRKAPKSEQEIAEIEAAERQDRRKGGFGLMAIRDRGWGRMSNGTVMVWHVDREDDGTLRHDVPDDHFMLIIDGKEKMFEAEEFRRWLRWV
jgi:hypothetical protein